MSGKCNHTSISDISVGAAVLTSQAYTAITITLTFSSVCRSCNYYSFFKAIKDSAEALSLYFSSQVAEAYNTVFSMDEFLTV
jgi:Na+/H+-dicarboxylate symporter